MVTGDIFRNPNADPSCDIVSNTARRSSEALKVLLVSDWNPTYVCVWHAYTSSTRLGLPIHGTLLVGSHLYRLTLQLSFVAPQLLLAVSIGGSDPGSVSLQTFEYGPGKENV